MSRSYGSRQPTSSSARSRGRLIVLSAPSGSGKTTVLEALRRTEREVIRSVSMTTRPPRVGERHGRDYWFVSASAFTRARKRGVFLECARILKHWYGTPRAPIERALRSGRDILLGVDVQGARQIRRSGLPVTTIFLLPPSLAALQERLRRRGTETPAQIRARLKLARQELAQVKHYDYAVVNDRLEGAIAAAMAILKSERFRVNRPLQRRRFKGSGVNG